MICDSPSHLYHSALPLSPSSSWVRSCYKANVGEDVRVLTGLPDRWDACSRTINLQGKPSAFAYQGNTIAVGLKSNVVLLDAITGVRMSALYGHTDTILSITFSLDGTLLVSRSKDETVKLWDIQTGGLIRTFSDHTRLVSAASISPDGTTIALGTTSGSICLWDVRTGRCHPIATLQGRKVNVVGFSPSDSRRFISSSGVATVQQWDVDGHQVGTSCYEECRVDDLTYASDGTRFVSCGQEVATVRDSESGEVVVKLGGQSLSRCCFSPDGRFVACGGDTTIYVWDITTSGARPIKPLVGHSKHITFLTFSSSLVSGSSDQSVKFWQSSNFLAESAATDHVATFPLRGPVPIRSVNLFAGDNTVVTSDESGVVKTWEIITGTCKSSFSTPAEGPRDTHLEGDALTIVWRTSNKSQHQYHIWDVYKGQLLRTSRKFNSDIENLKISGDGAKIFGLGDHHIEAVSMETGDALRVWLKGRRASNFFVRGSKVGIDHSRGRGWDFVGSKVPEFGEFPDRPRLDLADRFTGDAPVEPRWIEDTVSKRPVFHIPKKYAKPGTRVEWDGRYLLIWSESGEVAIMDFDPVQRALDWNR